MSNYGSPFNKDDLPTNVILLNPQKVYLQYECLTCKTKDEFQAQDFEDKDCQPFCNGCDHEVKFVGVFLVK